MSPNDATIDMDGPKVHCAGAWTSLCLRGVEQKLETLGAPPNGRVIFDMRDTSAMDTAGAWLLHRSMRRLAREGFEVSSEGLSTNGQAMLELVIRHAFEETAVKRAESDPGFVNDIGNATVDHLRQSLGFLAFIGELTLTALPLLLKPARVRWTIVLNNLQTAGADALPIVGLLAFLLGVVIGYQGGIPLRDYGATLFVADLVGLAMVRELAPLITAIIIAGRTGSAYTAQIGTMKVTEEVDALRTIGITPMELLVVPKVVALMVALPLLTVFADILGILGGMVMAKAVLDMTFASFADRLGEAIDLGSFLIGIGKAPVFAAIIACVGCYQGFKVSGSAESVGRQTTKSVVQAIFLVLIIDAGFSVIFSILGI